MMSSKHAQRALVVGVSRRDGHVIVLSSLADSLVSAEAPSYNASKAGLSSSVEGLGLALRSTFCCPLP